MPLPTLLPISSLFDVLNRFVMILTTISYFLAPGDKYAIFEEMRRFFFLLNGYLSFLNLESFLGAKYE